MNASDVWVAKDDGSDIIRAASIVAVGRDYNGNVTVRLAGGEQSAVTLVAIAPHEDQHAGGLSSPADPGRGPAVRRGGFRGGSPGVRRAGRLALGHRSAVKASTWGGAGWVLALTGLQAAYWS